MTLGRAGAGTRCITVMKEKSMKLPLVSLWQFTAIRTKESEPALLAIMAGEENIAYYPVSESVIQE